MKKRVHSQLYLLHISTDPSYRAPAVINLGWFPPTWLCASVPTFKWLPANVLKSLCSTSCLPRGLRLRVNVGEQVTPHALTQMFARRPIFQSRRRGYVSACMHTPKTNIWRAAPRLDLIQQRACLSSCRARRSEATLLISCY